MVLKNVEICGINRVVNFRRSFNSQEKSDSSGDLIGPKDLEALRTLVQRGDSHAKVMRFVIVYFDLTLPRRVWVDFDTYRYGVEKMSDSTMHTLTKKELTPADFDKYTDSEVIFLVNDYIKMYKENPSEDAFLRIKSTLPEGFLQTRTVMANYQSLRHIYKDRLHHRQPEFRKFCRWIETLPYSILITC